MSREKPAACPGLPSDVVETPAADPDVRGVVELVLWTAPESALRPAVRPHAEVRRAVAADEAAPPAPPAVLVSEKGLPEASRCLVCERGKTPFDHDPQGPRLDSDLPPGASCDGSHESTVRAMPEAALRHPATPVEAVVGFVGHPSMLLRWALATRRELPRRAGERLAADPTPGIRADLADLADLAENPALDVALIHALADDRAPGGSAQSTKSHRKRPDWLPGQVPQLPLSGR